MIQKPIRKHWLRMLYMIAFSILLIPVCSVNAAEVPEEIATTEDLSYTDELGNIFTYTIDAENNVKISGITVAGNDLIIPETIEDAPVTTIGNKRKCVVQNPDVVIPLLEINCHTVETNAFKNLTIDTLIIGEDVKDFISYYSSSAPRYHMQFSSCTIGKVIFNAKNLVVGRDNAEKEEAVGPFYEATIRALEFGDNVEIIPELMFSGAIMELDTLELQVERIGAYAFKGWDIKINHLILGKNVKWMEESSIDSVDAPKWETFTDAQIGKFTFLANDLQLNHRWTKEDVVEGARMYGPFMYSHIEEIEIGSEVTRLPELFIAESMISIDELHLTQPVIGARAFYGTMIEKLYIHSTVEVFEESFFSTPTERNWEQFGGSVLPEIYYDAQNLKLTTDTGDAVDNNCKIYGPFGRAFIGKVIVADNVELIDAKMFSGNTEDGEYSGLFIIANCYVYALEASEEHLEQSISDYDLLVTNNLSIHRNSDFHPYFSRQVTTYQWLCEDYMETTYGEPVLDEISGKYIVDVLSTCSVCGYEEESEEILDDTYDLYLSVPLEFDLIFDEESRSYIGSEPIYAYGRLGNLYSDVGYRVVQESDSYGKAILDENIYDVRKYLIVNFDNQEIAKFSSLQLQENAQMVLEDNLENLHQYQMNVSVGIDAFVEGGIGSYQIMIPTRFERYNAY